MAGCAEPLPLPFILALFHLNNRDEQNEVAEAAVSKLGYALVKKGVFKYPTPGLIIDDKGTRAEMVIVILI